MKNEIKEVALKAANDLANKPITRKEALKKTGFMALSAATMMLLLSNPAEAGGREGREDRRGHRHSGPATSPR